VLEVGAPPVSLVVSCRRYLCVACGCVMLVVPRELSRLRRYTLTTIALAIASVGSESAGRIRARLAPGATYEDARGASRSATRGRQRATATPFVEGLRSIGMHTQRRERTKNETRASHQTGDARVGTDVNAVGSRHHEPSHDVSANR